MKAVVCGQLVTIGSRVSWAWAVPSRPALSGLELLARPHLLPMAHSLPKHEHFIQILTAGGTLQIQTKIPGISIGMIIEKM